MTLKFGLLVVCALIFLAACGGNETAVPNPSSSTIPVTTPTRQNLIVPTPPPGWALYSRSTFQIALPDSWQEVKLQEADLKNAIAAAQNSNPPLADQLRTLLESGQYKSFVFYATEKASEPIVQNVSVARLTLVATNDIQTFAKAYADALPNVVRGAQVVEVQAPLQVNGIHAASIVYNVSLVDNSGNLTTLRGVQYLYLLDSGDAYVVTVTGNSADSPKLMPLAREIATSFVGVTP